MITKQIYYKVCEHKFYNLYSACDFAASFFCHEPVKFYFNDEKFQSYNWQSEPETSFKELMIKRALQIREKYKKIILFFSGGTDSWLMYKIFRDLKIKIDEIVIGYHNDNFPGAYGYSNQIVKWMHKHHYDNDTKITPVDRLFFAKNYIQQKWRNSNFIFDEKSISGHPFFSLTSDANELNKKFQEHYKEKWCMILGAEKPYVVCRKGEWYATHLDKQYNHMMALDNCEFFYISEDLPDLHIKQHHMIKNFFKQKLKIESDWDSGSWCNNSMNYYMFANACGREDELLSGASYVQKTFTRSVAKSFESKHGNVWNLINDFSPDYVKAITNFEVSEKTKNYMERFHFTNFRSNNKLSYSTNGLYSMLHYLGR